MAGSRHREEFLNINFSRLLNEMEILSDPETIESRDGRNRLLDIVFTYQGIRGILEGKIADVANCQSILERDCAKRIEEGLAYIVIGIIYPAHLRGSKQSEIRQHMLDATYLINVFSESGNTGWMNEDIEGINRIIRVAYESLVSENIVDRAVDNLDQHIEFAASLLSSSPGTYERLKTLLTSPNS
jgi:hypothetical protein